MNQASCQFNASGLPQESDFGRYIPPPKTYTLGDRLAGLLIYGFIGSIAGTVIGVPAGAVIGLAAGRGVRRGATSGIGKGAMLGGLVGAIVGVLEPVSLV